MHSLALIDPDGCLPVLDVGGAPKNCIAGLCVSFLAVSGAAEMGVGTAME